MDGRQLISQLEALRRAAGYSVEGFAEAIGFDRAYVSRVERGRQRPSREFRRRAVEVLGPNLDRITFGPEPTGS